MDETIGVALHARFLRGLARSPHGVAVRVGAESVTYEEAHQRALSWAEALLRTRPRAVAVLAAKGVTAYTGILAALYAGAAVVPLRPDFPVARTRQMLDASGATALVADEDGVAVLARLLADRHDIAVLAPCGGWPDAIAADCGTHLDEPITVVPQDPALMLFTSGSTGRPKGVVITHGSAGHYFRVLDARYDFTADDVFSQTFDLNFDCAVFDMFSAWGAGAQLLAVPPYAYRELPAFLGEHRVTVWFSTPSAIGLARRTGGLRAGAMPGLRWSLFAGEALQCRDAADWQRAAPASALENLYGPTELTITVAAHRWSPERSALLAVNGVVPIGILHDGHEHMLLDEDGEPADGEGELCVTGPQLSPGYIDPDDDRGRFEERSGRRWYRTGDRVRRAAGGQFVYLGRLDSQVQVQGWRLELAEVEHALRTATPVRDAVAVGLPAGGSTELVVFYTGSPVPPVEFARSLRQTLPEAVIPRHYHQVEEFPLNSNRKIDRAQLAVRARELHPPARVRSGNDDKEGKGTGVEDGVNTVQSSPRDSFIHCLLEAAAGEVPDSPAVRDAVGAWTYRALDEFSHAFASWLAEQGVGSGDRVVVQLPTTRELAAMLYGTSRRGAVFVPVNPAMKPFHLRPVIESAQPRLVIGADAELPLLGEVTGLPRHGLGEVWRRVTELREKGARSVPAGISPDDVAVLVYTSGSTAAPKGVVEPHAQVVFAASAIQAVLGYRPDDVVFCRFPISWDYGLYKVLLACLGRSQIVLAGGESDLLLLRRMRDVGATIVPIVPSLATMIVSLAEREAGPAAPVRMFTNTGAALPSAVISQLRRSFPGARVVRQFGQTECKRISIMPPEQDTERPGSVGRPLPGTRVLILDERGERLPVGETGEIVVAGPHVMPGYWRAPELTARTFRPDSASGELCLHTGDYGHLDEDSYLYFEGRRDDMFKRKGIRVSSLEIEAAAMDIPGVRAAGAIPPTVDRDLALCVETDLPPHVVLRELARRLEPAKVPAICHVVAEFPLTAHGKNATSELARLLEENRP